MKTIPQLSFATLILGLALQTIAAQDACADQFTGNTSPTITNPRLQPQSRKLCFDEFAVIHSGIFKTPLVAGEHLTRERVIAAS